MNTGIPWLSVGRIIYGIFGAVHPEENNMLIRLQMYSRVVEQHN